MGFLSGAGCSACHELARANFSRCQFSCGPLKRRRQVSTSLDQLKCDLQPVLHASSTLVAKGVRTTAFQRIPMSLDNNRRAVLTVAALTHLVEMKRKISLSDKEGFATFESLEQLVINLSLIHI